MHTFFWHKFILIELFVFTFYKFSLSLSCIECVKKTKFNCCNNITNSRLFIFSFIFWKYLKICFRFAFCSLPSDSHSQSVFSGFSFGHHTYVFDVKSDEKLRKKNHSYLSISIDRRDIKKMKRIFFWHHTPLTCPWHLVWGYNPAAKWQLSFLHLIRILFLFKFSFFLALSIEFFSVASNQIVVEHR